MPSSFYSHRDGFSELLNQLGKFALLTADQEISLARDVQAGIALSAERPDGPLDAAERRIIRRGIRAKQKFIETNLRLVVSITKGFYRSAAAVGMGKDDLFSEGCLGLDKAVDRFDPSKGYKFSTYATWWIRQSVFRAISNQGTIRVPIHVGQALRKAQKLPDSMTFYEKVESLGLMHGEAQALRCAMNVQGIGSLDVRSDQTNSQAVIDSIAAEDTRPDFDREELAAAVEQLRALDPDAVASMELEVAENFLPRQIADLVGCGLSTMRGKQAVAKRRLVEARPELVELLR
jgi:RNA polymerase sigma factor (sigma-70 family)